MKLPYRIRVIGCDDETVVTRDLTETEAELLEAVAAEITEASEYDCMPRVTVELVAEGEA
jgi:hypothetical protein